jgi:hypothetical protein
MGHHYIPREFLRGFAEPGSEDWIHQDYRKAKKVSRIRIRDAAQERSFYPEEIETYLAQTIEGPANTVLNKLREGKAITPKDKTTLAIYIIQLGSRVPIVKESSMEVAPNLVDSVVTEMEEEISSAIARDPALASRAADLRKEPLQFSNNFRKGPEPWHAYLIGEKPKSVAALSLMNWAFMLSGEDDFVTSDNPVFLESGFGKPEGGLTVPLSSDIVLFASWTLGLWI